MTYAHVVAARRLVLAVVLALPGCDSAGTNTDCLVRVFEGERLETPGVYLQRVQATLTPVR